MRRGFRFATMIALLFLLTAATGGCSTFRKIFSSKDPSLERENNTEKKQKAEKKKKKLDEDPVYDRIFHTDERHSGTQSELLSEQERSVVNANVSNTGSASSDPDVRSIHDQHEKSRIRNKDFVFGTKDGSYFP